MPKIKKLGSKFKGILSRPIRDLPRPQRNSGVPPSLASLSRWQDKRRTYIDAQRKKRLHALLDHYAIDPSGPADRVFYSLALRLAEEIVTGFRIVSAEHRTGAHRKWTLAAKVELLEAVATQMKRNKRLSPKGACIRLAGPGKKYEQLSGESLYTTFLAIKRRIPNYLLLKAVLADPRGHGLSDKSEDGVIDAVFGPRE